MCQVLMLEESQGSREKTLTIGQYLATATESLKTNYPIADFRVRPESGFSSRNCVRLVTAVDYTHFRFCLTTDVNTVNRSIYNSENLKMPKDFNAWNVTDLAEFLRQRGISVSLRRKKELIRLCELAEEIELEVLTTVDDYRDMDIVRRKVVLDGGEEKTIDEISVIKDWNKSLTNLPDIDHCHVFIYLMKVCGWREERLKSYKNDNGHRLFVASHVDNVTISDPQYQHFHYVRATCVPETRQSAAPYNVWVLAKDTGKILSGGCSCVVDNGTCKHCVALLFSLQSFCTRHKDRDTEVGTDVQCAWDKPRRESAPMEVDSIDIRKDPSRPPSVTPTTQYCKPTVTNVNEEETARKLKQLCKGTNALLLQTLYTESDDSDEDEYLPTLADALKCSDMAPMDAIKSAYDVDTVHKIEDATRGQSNNPAWFSHRRGRITASIVPSVMSFRYTDAPENYISKQVLGNSARVSSASLEFGKIHEPIARQMYINDYATFGIVFPMSMMSTSSVSISAVMVTYM